MEGVIIALECPQQGIRDVAMDTIVLTGIASRTPYHVLDDLATELNGVLIVEAAEAGEPIPGTGIETGGTHIPVDNKFQRGYQYWE